MKRQPVFRSETPVVQAVVEGLRLKVDCRERHVARYQNVQLFRLVPLA
jgi:hypothetical protein